jgi:hypothetical protein
MQRESGSKGADFDLLISKHDAQICVEVTARKDGPCTVEAIENTIRKKRKQLPPGKPAILFIRVPAAWMRNEKRYQSILGKAISNVFRRSRRLNAVVFVWEEAVPYLSGANIQMSIRACYHNSPRHSSPDIHQLEGAPVEGRRNILAGSFLEWLEAVEATRT